MTPKIKVEQKLFGEYFSRSSFPADSCIRFKCLFTLHLLLEWSRARTRIVFAQEYSFFGDVQNAHRYEKRKQKDANCGFCAVDLRVACISSASLGG